MEVLLCYRVKPLLVLLWEAFLDLWERRDELLLIAFVASPGSMHDTGCLGLVHWDDPEGGYGEGGGRRVQDGEHMYTIKDRIPKNKRVTEIRPERIEKDKVIALYPTAKTLFD